jgi:hypothetical protein
MKTYLVKPEDWDRFYKSGLGATHDYVIMGINWKWSMVNLFNSFRFPFKVTIHTPSSTMEVWLNAEWFV